MSSNKELVAQAVATIPLWRAFLDAKEAEQDTLLAEVRNQQPEEIQLPESSNQEFQRRETNAEKPEDLENAADQKQKKLSAMKSEQAPFAMTPPIEPPPATLPEKPLIEPPPAAPPATPPENEQSDSEDFDSEEEEFNDLF